MNTKLSEILLAASEVLEGITPTVESYAGYQRWKGNTPLAAAREATALRAFKLVPTRITRGKLNSNSSQQSKAALIQLQVFYPESFSSKTDSNLNVELMISEDDALLVSSLCLQRPLQLQTLSNASALKWNASFRSGFIWVIEFEVEYFEPNL